ncbi:MAG TPA: RNase adapter RapZ [Mycobacteriales bacterium]|nr:RNase adapter RapZ [Mycobacteriales bacterium]
MSDTTAPEPVDLTIITGLSGAGRSEAAKCLEDLGWFVVDNLPPALLHTMAELVRRSQGAVSRLAVVVDVRGRAFFPDLRSGLDELDAKAIARRIVFLEASDEALVRRFEHVRRPHPLQEDGRLVDGISRERELLQELRGEADLVIDTSDLNVHELREKVGAALTGPADPHLRATVVSFGFKYGLPVDADLVVDCRFLPNPHWHADLRPFTGRDDVIKEFVLGQPGAEDFLDRYDALLDLLAQGYLREGKRYLTIAVGCTGGKHRSVVMAEEIAARLGSGDHDVKVIHRDLGRE